MSERMIDRPGRSFQVWSYTVGMKRLLLRSTKAEGYPTRVDVLFQNVRAIELPTLIDGLIVTRADSARQAEITGRTGLIFGEETLLFDIESAGRLGYVVAGVVVEDEDAGEYFEPSKFWPGSEGFTR